MFFRQLRRSVLVIAPLQVICVSFCIFAAVYATTNECATLVLWGLFLAGSVGGLRLLWFFGTGWSQVLVASSVLKGLSREEKDGNDEVAARLQRRSRYNWWVRWSRAGTVVTVFQLIISAYLSYVLTYTLNDRGNSKCHQTSDSQREEGLTISSLRSISIAVCVLSWVVSITQLIVGNEVMTWRALYLSKDKAWRAHYREMFDSGIREFLCCLGRPQTWKAEEDDDVDAVAALLGDLVAYRAVGASHLEVLAGMALLKADEANKIQGEGPPPPPDLLKEAAALHPYAVAAYTGWLLDVGRNPICFLCVWLWRQGVFFAPWTRNQRPALEGDNMWRGHAAAFLRYTNLKPEVLQKGRVKQLGPAQAVYFVVVLHPLKTVVVAVRGTETPEDLIIDGLGRECPLTETDLSGILGSEPSMGEQSSGSGGPQFGHAGVVASARELAFQLDNMPEEEEEEEEEETDPEAPGKRISQSSNQGLLSKLLKEGGSCEGYALRFVGHSLGGAVATLTGLRLVHRFPTLHVYGYGTLPCVDYATAKACIPFVTSIVYNDEFSCRLSVASVMRLRAKALRAIAADLQASPILQNITNKFLEVLPNQTSNHMQDLAAKGSEAVTFVTQSMTQMMSKIHAKVRGGVMGWRTNSRASESQRRRVPKQWFHPRNFGAYEKEDKSSLAQYSMFNGGDGLKEWRKPEDREKLYKKKKRRRQLKHQAKGLGCIINLFCLCIGTSSRHGRSRPKVDSKAIAKSKFDICEVHGTFRDVCGCCVMGEGEGEVKEGGGEEEGAMAVGAALGLGRNNVREGAKEGNGEDEGVEGVEGRGDAQNEGIAEVGSGNALLDQKQNGFSQSRRRKKSTRNGVGEGEKEEVGEHGKAELLPGDVRNSIELKREMVREEEEDDGIADRLSRGIFAGKEGEINGGSGYLNMPLLKESVEEAEEEMERSEVKRHTQDGKSSREGKRISGEVVVDMGDENVEDVRKSTPGSRSEEIVDDGNDLEDESDEKEVVAIAKQLEAVGFTLGERSSRSVNLTGLDNFAEDLDTATFPAEVYVPGQILHIIREDNSFSCEPLGGILGKLQFTDNRPNHRAVIGSQEMLKDMVVSPTMFLDHLPWRCSHALNELLKVLEEEKLQSIRFSSENTTVDVG